MSDLDDGTRECIRHPGNRDGYYRPKLPRGKRGDLVPWCPVCRRTRRHTHMHVVFAYADADHPVCTCGWLNCPETRQAEER